MLNLAEQRQHRTEVAANRMGHAVARLCYESRSLAPFIELMDGQRGNPEVARAVHAAICAFACHLHGWEGAGGIRFGAKRPLTAGMLEFFFLIGNGARYNTEAQLVVDYVKSMFAQPLLIEVTDGSEDRTFNVRVQRAQAGARGNAHG